MSDSSIFNWTYLSSLPLKPKVSFFQNKNIKEIIDQFPTGPDPTEDTTVVNCLTSPLTVSVVNNKYKFGNITNIYGVTQGVYRLIVPEEHPIAFLNFGKTSKISYTGSNMIDKRAFPAIDGNYGYLFFYGDVYITVEEDFDTISYCCMYHGYEGGQDNLRYKSSCEATPDPVINCLSGTNTLDIVDGQLKINDEDGPYGVNSGNYNINFNFATEQGVTHALRFYNDNKELSIYFDGNTSGTVLDNGPTYSEGIQLIVLNNFEKISVKCAIHPEEVFEDCFVFSQTCSQPISDDYEPVIYVPPTVIEAYLILYSSVNNDVYTVCDVDGTFLAVDEFSGIPSFLLEYLEFPITYPFQSTDNMTGIIYNIIGLYTEYAEGDYKIMDPPVGILPSGYYLLTDVDGTPIQSTNESYLGDYIGIPWDGSATFPFSAVGIYALGSSSNNVSTNTTYSIIGTNILVVPNCRIAMAKIGEYETPNVYMVVDADGNQIDDQFLVSAQNVADVTARVIWDPANDTFPSTKSHVSASSTAKYSIVAYYTFMDPTVYQAKHGKLNEYGTPTTYTLVDVFGTPKYDPGTNNTTLVEVELPDTQTFPVIKFPSTAYNVIQYQIGSRYIQFQPGSYTIKQQITDDAPDPRLYTLIDSNGNEVDDPGTNNTTKITISRSPFEGLPSFFRSLSWFVNFYRVIGIYSQTAGDYTMKYPGTGTIYDLVDKDGNKVKDVGTNETTDVTINWLGNSTSSLPIFVRSTSGYTGITYRVTKLDIPRPIILNTNGPTGPSGGTPTGPTVTNIQYYFGSLFESFPDFQSATGPYTGPTTESLTEVNTEASGPLEGAAPPGSDSIAAGSSIYFISADNVVTRL